MLFSIAKAEHGGRVTMYVKDIQDVQIEQCSIPTSMSAGTLLFDAEQEDCMASRVSEQTQQTTKIVHSDHVTLLGPYSLLPRNSGVLPLKSLFCFVRGVEYRIPLTCR